MMQTIDRPTTRTASAPTLLTVKLTPRTPAHQQVISLRDRTPVRVKLAA